jgi:hypothetical protein
MTVDLSDHVKRLRELYDGKAKDFQRYFVLLNVLSMFILMFILVPFVLTEIDKVNVLMQINSTRNGIATGNENIRAYESAITGIDILHKTLSNGSDDLRKFILSIENLTAAPEIPSSESDVQEGFIDSNDTTTFPQCQINEMSNQEWLECTVNEKLQLMIDEYNKILSTNITNPLNTLDEDSKKIIGFYDLKTDVQDLQIRLNNTLVENPKFWKTFPGKTGFFAELDGQIEIFWQRYDSRIKSQSISLKTSLEDLEFRLKNSNSSLAKLNEEQENIKKRIDEFESPIGKLTAGFRDVIIVFPLALGGGFLVCASILIETARIRREYLRFHPKNENFNVLSEEDIARTAPLWLDPKDTQQKKSIRIFVLLLPLILYCVAAGLILYDWNLPGNSIELNLYSVQVMSIIYIFFGFAVFILSFYFIRVEFEKGKLP